MVRGWNTVDLVDHPYYVKNFTAFKLVGLQDGSCDFSEIEILGFKYYDGSSNDYLECEVELYLDGTFVKELNPVFYDEDYTPRLFF